MIINGKKLLEISPIRSMHKTKEIFGNTSYGLGECGYDIRIAQDIYFDYDLIERTDSKNNREKFTGKFVLASAMEEFIMPLNLCGIVHDKSTWARQGLSVFNTVIEAGFCGGLTLELVYHGNSNLFIPAGSGIAQVIFHEIIEPAEYTGKYQNQSTNPEPAR